MHMLYIIADLHSRAGEEAGNFLHLNSPPKSECKMGVAENEAVIYVGLSS